MNKKQYSMLLLTAIMLLLVAQCVSQTLKVSGKLLLNNKITLEKFKVSVVDLDNDSTYTREVVNGFINNLDYNKNYLIVISKQGFQTKAIAVDTHCNLDKPFKYLFYVNLVDTEPIVPDAQYAGGIFFNKNKKEFDYYLR